MNVHVEYFLFAKVVGSGCVVNHASVVDCDAQLTASSHAVGVLTLFEHLVDILNNQLSFFNI